MEEKFDALFSWNEDRIEDVRFWCEPELTLEAIRSIRDLSLPDYDGLVTFEARGFFLAGIASAVLNLPVVFIRKHKPFYDKMDHQKMSFTNWKGEPETLTILKKSMPPVKKVMVVDDILDTGRSLQAGVELLNSLDVEVAGAYYLLNAANDKVTGEFKFPIYSAKKRHLF